MSAYLSKRFAGMQAYVPGEQPQGRTFVKLNTNESPFPPAPAVCEAISKEQVAQLNLYPDPGARETTAAIAAYYGVKKENVLLGNGSDEILAFCFQAYCDEATPAVFSDITYGFYKVFAQIYCVPARIIPLGGDFSINIEKYYNAKGTVFIANPNAPTGMALPLASIEKCLQENAQSIVVVDEAYVDFGAESAVSLLGCYKNLIVVQTMSKSRNLAGARLGYAIAGEELIADLAKMKFSFNPYSVNRLSLLAAKAAIEDEAYFRACTEEIVATRAFTAAALEKRNFSVLNSAANFVFAKPPLITAEEYYSRLREHGILVRLFSGERVREYVRITIGAKEQMRQLIQATDEIWREL